MTRLATYFRFMKFRVANWLAHAAQLMSKERGVEGFPLFF